MMEFRRLAMVEEIPLGEAKEFVWGDRKIGVFHRSEGFFALDNLCPHRGAPLHEGGIFEDAVICPWHQWDFDLRTGKCRSIPGVKARIYAVEIRGQEIWVKL